MSLDDFGFTECDPKNQHTCDGANEHDRIDTRSACELYACDAEKRCVLGPRDADGDHAFDADTCKGEVADEMLDCADNDKLRAPGASEMFDGVDNDCDGLIDEGDVERPAPSEVAGDLYLEQRFLSVASDATKTFVAVGRAGAEGMDTPLGFTITGDGAETAPLRYLSLDDSSPGDPLPMGCPLGDGTIDPNCSFDDVAMAPYSGHLVYATISRAGCAAGKVLLGISRSDAPFDVLLGKPSGVSADATQIEFGVQTTGCRGDLPERPAIAARPAVAVLEPVAEGADGGVPDTQRSEDDSLEALALWLGGEQPAPSPACGPVAQSRVVALRLRVRSAYRDYAWLSDATADGAPSVLDRPNTGNAAPSLVAWNRADHAGYFAAYPTADGILVGFLPVATEDVDAKATFDGTSTRLDDPNADQVVLSLGQDVGAPAGVRLRVAWRSGCGADATIQSAALTFDAEREAFSTPVTSRIAPAPFAHGPALQYAATGFAVDEPRGGWVVLWTEGEGKGTRAAAARVREGDHKSLGSFELSSGRVDHGFLYPVDNANVRYGLVRDMTSLRLGPLSFTVAAR